MTLSPPRGATPEPALPGRLVVIGNFDGVHRGHRAVLEAAVRLARERALLPAALTFHPHPARVLGREPPPVLTAPARKLELMERIDPELLVIVRRFDEELAAKSPEAFARDVLVRELGARHVVVGKNFRFGRGRVGDEAQLARLGAALGFEVGSVPLSGDAQGTWSSSRARAAIAAGDLEGARDVLGRPHMVSGEVVRGDRRGRALGFPTANLAAVPEALPPLGVYAAVVDLEPGGESAARGTALATGVANVGVRPTFGAIPAAGPVVEVHLLDAHTGGPIPALARGEELYGARLRLHLVRRLRGERRFAGAGELAEQIARDVEAARAALLGVAPDPGAGGAWF